MKQSLVNTAALTFCALFILIIIIANRGAGGEWFAMAGRIPYGDKYGHLILVGLLSFLCNLALSPLRRKWLPPWITLTSAVLLVLLTIEETSQLFLTHRTFDGADLLADIAGLAVGQFLGLRLRKRIFD